MAEKKQKMSLMQLDQSIMEIQAELEQIASENEGEIPEEKLKALIELQAKVPEKLNNIVSFIRYTDTLLEMYKAEKKRMDTKRGVAENTIKNIKNYIKFFMEASKLKKLEAVTSAITLVEKKAIEIEKNEAKEEIIDQIPDKYCVFNLELEFVEFYEKVVASLRSGDKVQLVITNEEGLPMLLETSWKVTKQPDRELILNTLKDAHERKQLLEIPGVRLIDNNHIMIK